MFYAINLHEFSDKNIIIRYDPIDPSTHDGNIDRNLIYICVKVKKIYFSI